MPTSSGSDPARGQSAGRRNSLSNYTGDSAAPASRDMVDADAFLAEGADTAASATQGQDDVAAAAVGETQGEDTAYEEETPMYQQPPAVRRGPQSVGRSQPPAQFSTVRDLPWKELPGPGRPRNIAHPADILDRRKVTRTPLHLSVPAALHLEERLRAYVFHNRVDVPGDVVGVALDQYLGQQGY